MRNTLIVTASLLVLLAAPAFTVAAPVNVAVERGASNKVDGGTLTDWFLTVSVPNNLTSPLKVTVTVTNAADTAKGAGATKAESHSLTMGPGAPQHLHTQTWGVRPIIRTAAQRVKEQDAQKNRPKDPDASAETSKPEPKQDPAASKQPKKSTPPAQPAKPAAPGSKPPAATKPTPGQKPSRR
jgi:hypothetical protein